MTIAAQRRTIAGTAKVVRFNWPKYAAVIAILVGAFTATMVGFPRPIGMALWIAGAMGLLWTMTSLGATWWVYDHRRVYDRVTIGLASVGDWASVHAGFDDATVNLARGIGWAPQRVVELAVCASPSLRRARGTEAHVATSGGVDSLPVAASSLDSIFVTFAAHEVRERAHQRALFAEFRRALRPGGRLVLTEHFRDLANFAVYGPGAFHFRPASVWIERAKESGFDLESDVSVTPFVHRVVWQR